MPSHAIAFGEDQSRYLLSAPANEAEAILSEAQAAGLSARRIGTVQGDAIALPGEATVPLAALRTAHERWLPDFMAAR